MKTTIKTNVRLMAVLLIASAAILMITSCKKYLDAKPDGALAEPQTLTDFQAILDAPQMNNDYPAAGDIGSDYYYLPISAWQALPLTDSRNDYIWGATAANDFDWLYMYTMILNANVVLDGAGKIPATSMNLADRNRVLGAGYFFRGYDHFALANEFAPAYQPGGSNSEQGIPLKLKADITDPTRRSPVRQDFEQILSDLHTAANLLPVAVSVKTRPSKAAAFGALARVYLVMGDYQHANSYADSCLKLNSILIDYNTVSATTAAPFKLFNDEVIFHNSSSGRGGVFSTTKELADTNLLASYAAGDLRKPIFFKATATGRIFKGDYGGARTPGFGGIAVDEIMLIRAESAVRVGKVSDGIADINTLLANRYATGSFTPYDANMSQDEALQLVLDERRKELPYRNLLRWTDLRRLNQDPRFAKPLTRILDGTTYSLAPGDKRYTLLVPVSVVRSTGIEQNPR